MSADKIFCISFYVEYFFHNYQKILYERNDEFTEKEILNKREEVYI